MSAGRSDAPSRTSPSAGNQRGDTPLGDHVVVVPRTGLTIGATSRRASSTTRRHPAGGQPAAPMCGSPTRHAPGRRPDAAPTFGLEHTSLILDAGVRASGFDEPHALAPDTTRTPSRPSEKSPPLGEHRHAAGNSRSVRRGGPRGPPGPVRGAPDRRVRAAVGRPHLASRAPDRADSARHGQHLLGTADDRGAAAGQRGRRSPNAATASRPRPRHQRSRQVTHRRSVSPSAWLAPHLPAGPRCAGPPSAAGRARRRWPPVERGQPGRGRRSAGRGPHGAAGGQRGGRGPIAGGNPRGIEHRRLLFRPTRTYRGETSTDGSPQRLTPSAAICSARRMAPRSRFPRSSIPARS